MNKNKYYRYTGDRFPSLKNGVYRYLYTEKKTGMIALYAKVRAFFLAYDHEIEEVEADLAVKIDNVMGLVADIKELAE